MGVMVQRVDATQNPTQPVISPGVMVNKTAAGQTPIQTVASAGVVVSKGPNIATLTPSTLASGATATLTLTGVNFTGATALRFLKSDGTLDTAVTAASLSVNGNGTSLTASVTATASATVGPRVVIVITPNGVSRTSNGGVGVNVLQIATSLSRPATGARRRDK